MEVKIWGWCGTYARYVGFDRGIDRYQPENIIRSYCGRVRVSRVGRGQPYGTPHKWRLGGLRTRRRAEECPTNPTSAVCRGRARLFKGLAKKSALHFEPRDQGRMDTEAFREVQPQAIQEAGLGGVGAYDTAQA